MAKANLPILPFPDHTDRQRFGDWLSGLTDGEGCFSLHLYTSSHGHTTPLANFALYLRADELPILRLIQSFFGCGSIQFVSRADQREKGMDTKDCYSFVVRRVRELLSFVIPTFERHPLRAKKQRDLVIWKEAILFLHDCSTSPRIRTGQRGGQVWNKPRLDHFRSLMTALKATRKYNAPNIPLPPPVPEEPSLFDLRE